MLPLARPLLPRLLVSVSGAAGCGTKSASPSGPAGPSPCACTSSAGLDFAALNGRAWPNVASTCFGLNTEKWIAHRDQCDVECQANYYNSRSPSKKSYLSFHCHRGQLVADVPGEVQDRWTGVVYVAAVHDQ